MNFPFRRWLVVAVIALSTAAPLRGQATSSIIDPLLKQHLQSSEVVAAELRNLMLQRVPPLPQPANANEWTQEAARMRTHELSVIYHGWPQAWIDEDPKFVEAGTIQGNGYRIVKLRYEVVPGMESVALLYEPSQITGKIPAILDVNGHGPGGKAVEQDQKRCINQARRGILALAIELIGYGDLASPENAHANLGLLELAGKNGAGLFYLAMRRGLDYLYNRPDVDRSRIGMTGVSGGGWQTILLSSLDPRIGPAVPVAGFSSLTTSIGHPEYHDMEQNAADLRSTVDYAQMVAMRAPRPTLLIYNSMDNCCFRAGIVKQGVYSDIQPFFKLYDEPTNLQWHLNLIPGTHNYGIDSREASYRFFDSVFHLDAPAKEFADTSSEVRSFEQLSVGGLPPNNLTILGLARAMAKSIHHQPPAQPGGAWDRSEQKLLKEVVRYAPVTVSHAWDINATHAEDVESSAYRFQFSNHLSATGVLFRATTTPATAPITVIIADSGMPSTTVDVTNQVDRGRRVLVFEPLFFGENTPSESRSSSARFAQLLNSVGVRPLGIEAAETTAVIHWLALGLDHGSPSPGSQAARQAAEPTAAATPVRILTDGPRSETVALVAAAIAPGLFSELDARNAISSLDYVFQHPLTYEEAPDLMCLDLYRDFDLNTLAAMAAPVKVNLAAKLPQRIFWGN